MYLFYMQMQFSLFLTCLVSICSFFIFVTGTKLSFWQSEQREHSLATDICFKYIRLSRVEYMRGVCFFWCNCGREGTFDSFSREINLETASKVSSKESSIELSSILLHNAWINQEPESLLRNE